MSWIMAIGVVWGIVAIVSRRRLKETRRLRAADGFTRDMGSRGGF